VLAGARRDAAEMFVLGLAFGLASVLLSVFLQVAAVFREPSFIFCEGGYQLGLASACSLPFVTVVDCLSARASLSLGGEFELEERDIKRGPRRRREGSKHRFFTHPPSLGRDQEEEEVVLLSLTHVPSAGGGVQVEIRLYLRGQPFTGKVRSVILFLLVALV
jgi:hypothetical protein